MRAGARKQAHVPAGAAVLEPAGTAPGFILGASPMVVVLPGPPRELQTMWAAAVETEPLRALLAGAGELEQRILRFFPLPEPQIAATLRDLDADSLPLEVTTCLRRGELELATVFTPSAVFGVRGVRGRVARAPRRRAVLRRRRDDRRGRRPAARRADAGDRGVVHGRADGGPADRSRGLFGLRPRRARRLFQRGQDGAGRRPRVADRGARGRLPGGGGRAGRGRTFALRGRHRDRDHGHRGAGRRYAGEARGHGVYLPLVVSTTKRLGPCASRARAETSGTARPPSPSTCCGRCSAAV